MHRWHSRKSTFILDILMRQLCGYLNIITMPSRRKKKKKKNQPPQPSCVTVSNGYYFDWLSLFVYRCILIRESEVWKVGVSAIKQNALNQFYWLITSWHYWWFSFWLCSTTIFLLARSESEEKRIPTLSITSLVECEENT